MDKTCFGGYSYRTGTRLVGYFHVIASFLIFVVLWLRLWFFCGDDEVEDLCSTSVIFVTVQLGILLNIILSAMLVIAAKKKNEGILLYWLVYNGIALSWTYIFAFILLAGTAVLVSLYHLVSFLLVVTITTIDTFQFWIVYNYHNELRSAIIAAAHANNKI